VILSDRCGNWGYSDTVQHRYNGLVYPCGNVEALSNAILQLTDSSTREQYNEHAKKVFLTQDLNCELNAFLNVVEKIKSHRLSKNSSKSLSPHFSTSSSPIKF
jgi:glycosyltransferase involved in cell wall biosynthesis